MKRSVLWNIMSCSLVKVSQHFGTAYPFHLQGQRTRQARNQHETSIGMISCLAYSLTLKLDTRHSSKMSTFTGLHNVIPENKKSSTVSFISNVTFSRSVVNERMCVQCLCNNFLFSYSRHRLSVQDLLA
jgi:hypothetical protein